MLCYYSLVSFDLFKFDVSHLQSLGFRFESLIFRPQFLCSHAIVHEEHAPPTDEQAGGWFSSWFASGDGGNEAMEETIAVPGDMASNVAELTTAVEALRTHPHVVHDRTVGAMQVLLPCFSHQPDPGDVSARLNAAAW